VLHEPTQGVDVGSRHDIINAIREAARDGCGVIISSVDAADLAVLCDRVLVFSDGKVVTELGGELTQDEIIEATFGTPGEAGKATAVETAGGGAVAEAAADHRNVTRKGRPGDGRRARR
jgi:ABC-type multidrug transport system ATPase subunit